MAAFPQCQAIIQRLQKRPSEVTIEQRLQQFQDETSENPLRKRQLAAIRFYLQSIISGCQQGWAGETRTGTNYQILLDHIDPLRRRAQEGVCLVTFNYDTMLEEALRTTLAISITELSKYVESPYPLFKLHGSVDWAREIDTPIYATGTASDQGREVIDRADRPGN